MFNDLEAHKLIGGTVISGGGTGWQRPSDWLEMPEVLETEQKFVGLFAVYDLPENFIAVYFEGDYTVDWGDGNIENFDGEDSAQHSYDWSDISSDTLTSEGYRQVLVTVTPQGGQDLTIMDLSVRHDNCPPNAYGSPWLDLAVSMPQADSGGSIRFNWDGTGAIGPGYLYLAQRIDIIHAGNMNIFDWAMYYNRSLRYARIRNAPNADSFYALFWDCHSLTDVILEDTSSVTNMDNMFRECSSLTTVPLFDTSSVTNMDNMFRECSSLTTVPLFDTSSVTNMDNMFRECSSLTTVPLFDTSSVTNMANMFYNCNALPSVPLFDTSSVTDMVNMFTYCESLTTVPLFDTSSVTNMYGMFFDNASLTSVPLLDTSSVTEIGNIFSYCNSLQIAALSGTKLNISYQNCLLGRQAIVDIFDNLAVVTEKTITIAGNYGTAELTQSDLDIAIDKGWTVIS